MKGCLVLNKELLECVVCGDVPKRVSIAYNTIYCKRCDHRRYLLNLIDYQNGD
jgi:hypothetical protein